MTALECSGCHGPIEVVGRTGDNQFRDACEEARRHDSSLLPESIPWDPFLFRGFLCCRCSQVACPECAAAYQDDRCPFCHQEALVLAYRPLLGPRAFSATGTVLLPQPGGLDPPGVDPGPRYAGIGRRTAAALIDGLILGAVEIVLAVVALSVSGLITTFLSVPARQVPVVFAAPLLSTLPFWLVIAWLYSAAFESSRRCATPGKAAVGLVVTTGDGQRLGFWRASLRFVGKIVSALPLGAGFAAADLSAHKRALHDVIAGTLVVRLPIGRAEQPQHAPTPTIQLAGVAGRLLRRGDPAEAETKERSRPAPETLVPLGAAPPQPPAATLVLESVVPPAGPSVTAVLPVPLVEPKAPPAPASEPTVILEAVPPDKPRS
jgi:uncharacterized RDD family membrane protein YckC